jgi:hypothetical protein
VSPRRVRESSSPARYFGWKAERAEPLHDTLERLQWVGGPPSGREWSNANFLLAETLRDKYDSANLVRLEFRGLPNTDSDYDIQADVAVRGPVHFHRIRTPREKPRPRKKTPRSQGSSQAAEQETPDFSVEPPGGYRLAGIERDLLVRFNRLPLKRRIKFWQKTVTPLFK